MSFLMTSLSRALPTLIEQGPACQRQILSSLYGPATTSSNVLSNDNVQHQSIRTFYQRRGTRKTFSINRSLRHPGHIDIYRKTDGEREPLQAAIDRFKRLDFGWYIRTRPGKDVKKWRKTDFELWRKEQHNLLRKDEVRRCELMFDSATKRKRFIPDDPYEKYNKMSWFKHRWAVLKNKELIRKYGNNDYRFDRYTAHLAKPTIFKEHYPNHPPKLHYLPPGFLKTVHDSPTGTFRQDPSEKPPEDLKAPHFKRETPSHPRFELKDKRKKFAYDKDFIQTMKGENYYGKLPTFSPLFWRRSHKEY